jgi:hypothetical protein
MAPLQLKRFKVGSKMAIATSAPVLLNQKKSVAKSPDSLMHPIFAVNNMFTTLNKQAYVTLL